MTTQPVTPIALVTGGSRGLGRNTALKLAEKGNDVILTYHSNRAEAEAVVAQIEQLGRRAVALQLDVGDSGSFVSFADHVRAQLTQRWQRERFDYLVNNAGIGAHATFAETTKLVLDIRRSWDLMRMRSDASTLARASATLPRLRSA